MKSTITSEVVVAYAQCPRKAYLLLFSSDQGNPHEYVRIRERQRREHQARYFDRLQQQRADVQPYTVENLRNGSEVLSHACLQADDFAAVCAVLTRVGGKSTGGKHCYEPTMCVGTHSISKEQKLEMAFAGYVLGRLQYKPPMAGKIIGMDGPAHTVNLGNSSKDLLPLLEPLQEWTTTASPEPPPIILNKHCPLCPFQRLCQAQAVQEDNLSRLRGVTPKVVRNYERKGIFTVKQRSYVFKPRRRNKRAKNPPPTTHKIELQALAIHSGKIYLQELPSLTRQETELVLDIESVPDQDLHYLIGLLVCQGETVAYYPLWASTAEDAERIWQAFLALVNEHSAAPIYHYGSYELRAVAKLSRRYETDSESVTKRLVNVHKQIYGKVYFPVYSNQLKEVARFVGATWTSPDAAGLKSLVWRHRWEETREDQYKDLLLSYNEEDCRALQLLVEELFKIQQSADTLAEVDFADQYKQRSTDECEQLSSQFKEILKLAHFNYDTKRIHFRQEDHNKESTQDKTEIRRLAAKKSHKKLINVRRKAKKLVQIPHGQVCPECGYKPLVPTKYISRRFIVDLVRTKNGIRKTITEHAGIKGYCRNCKKTSAPQEIRKYPRNRVYGHGFGAWVVYQRVALRLPYEGIVESASEQFGETFANSQPQQFLKRFAKYYAMTEKKIAESLFRSPFVHVDETKVNIQGANWYVWVITDAKHVIFRLTDNRETTVVEELLANYNGVLIADFYPGYDSIQCKQQRCWVHLIRDLNDDLREHPFDREYEAFVLEVRDLIVPIMEAVQKYGLKKRHLQRFVKQVDVFYQRMIIDRKYKSDLVCKYQKRFIRYRDGMFTFLEQDGIPWNNNAAERAIRHFAIQRDISKSPFHASVLHRYLVLPAIRQACRFQDKSFFKFLFSGETDLDKFEARKHKL